jgi:hypothetical protein
MMETAPNIGDRVKLKPGHRYYPCAGVVTRIYPKNSYVEADDDPAWDDEDFIPTISGRAAQRDWQVAMKVDATPNGWAYGDSDVFAPSVSEIEPA